MKKILAPLAILFVCSAFAAPVTEVKVKALDGFGGNVGAVLGRCQTRVGTEFNAVTASHDVNTLKTSGAFEDISVDAVPTDEGIVVTFYVTRKITFIAPLQIKITGEMALSESKIAKEAKLKDGFLYGEADLAEAASRVRLAYLKKNYHDVKVTPKVSLNDDGLQNGAHITFEIDEGVRRDIREVVFRGATHLSGASVVNRNFNPFYSLEEGMIEESEVRDAIGDLPWWNPIGWFSDGPITYDQRVQCCDKIAEVYRNHGYLDVEVTGPQFVDVAEGQIDLVFTIDEGTLYRVNSISVVGLTRYAEEDILAPEAETYDAKDKRVKPLKSGSIAGQKAIDDLAHQIKVAVGSGTRGLADSQVAVKRIISETDPTHIDFVMQVTEGVPVVIDDIVIRGNDYTKDRVIRREIKLDPGVMMYEDHAEMAQRRLENLGYFERVRYSLETTDRGTNEEGAEYRNLVYEVAEKNTGSFMIGIGASSVDSIYVSAEVNQNNFDLFAPKKFFRGGGQKGRAYVAWGPRYQSAELGFAEPYFLGRTLELSVDLYRRMRWYDQYDLYRTGGDVSLSYPVKFWPTWDAFGRLGIGISGEFIEFDDVENGVYTFAENPRSDFTAAGGKTVSYREEERQYGDAFEPVLHLFWVKDDRDSRTIPTSGYRLRVFGDIAPAGDNEYWRAGLHYRHYWNVWKRYNHVLMVGLRAETIDAFSGDVPIYNRMFLGGPKSIRGIEYRNVGPMVRRQGTNSWSPWGGQTLVCANLEYTIPIVNMFRFAVFTDIGSVGEDVCDVSDDFAWTVGAGLRLDIPMFPIRLDLAAPVKCPDHAEEQVFSFSVGYDF